MLDQLLDALDDFRKEYRRWRYGPPPPQPSQQQPPVTPPAEPPSRPTPPRAAPTPAPVTLTPLKNWSYPFKVQTGGQEDPISQLTHMSKALAGFYPLGINGMWHGGVHFDAGTASTLDQSHVSCLADGEVVAYRIPTATPRTTYHRGHDDTVSLPFANGFVLVRHRLQAPAIEGKTEPPPSLLFYSLYMHLEDWASYQADAAKARPVFWAASSYRVKTDVADPGPIGLTVHDKPSPKGAIVSVLPRGNRVTIGGAAPTHGYVKLMSAEGIELPALGKQHGTARGYVRRDALESVEGAYRVKDNALGQKPGDQLNIHATAAATSKVTGTLARGTELVVSGDGAYRKLEAVIPQGLEGTEDSDVPELPAYGGDFGHQAPEGYVRFAALAPIIAPLQLDTVAFPEPPIPIKAGQLIGHIGPYHDMKKSEERKLHLEVFTAQDMVKFLADSRDWARQLPESERTWLKLAKGTRVISHQDSYKKATPPTLQDAGKESADDLLIPRSLLDGLRAEWKIQLPATGEQKARNWYRLDSLLNDATGNLIDGWVCEEVGVTPWVSPWAWEGYDIIVNVNPLEEGLAYFKQLHTDLGLQAMADRWDKGPLQARLYDIIGTGPDNKLTASKIRKALETPARAQSIAQLVIQYESEWRYTAKRMEPLDKLLGHTRTEPILNWIAEKERWKALSFWDDVWGKVGLPEAAKVYHLHSTGMVGVFTKKRHPSIVINGERVYLDFLLFNEEKSIQQSDFEEAAAIIGCEVAAIKAVAATETGSTGSFYKFQDWDFVPAILYERHYFHNLTGGRYDESNQSISSRTPGGYGQYVEQYPKLLKAYDLDAPAALKSASWGKFQIMGKNHKACGFDKVEDFILSISKSEKNQLKAFVNFILADSKLKKAIQKKDWLAFARIYNGPKQSGYDHEMRRNYEEFSR